MNIFTILWKESMEIVPILSFIFLVVAFSTFILSIGAAIIEVMKQKRGSVKIPADQYIKADLIVPVSDVVKTKEIKNTNIEVRNAKVVEIIVDDSKEKSKKHPYNKNLIKFR